MSPVASGVRAVRGVLLSCSELEAQERFFGQAFGLQVGSREELSAARVEALWGLPGRRAQTTWMHTPGTEVGVRLVAFDPGSPTVIRGGNQGVDCDALKVVDFAVRDIAQATRHVRSLGYEVQGPARYEVPGDGEFSEGHVHGPDGVICALLQMHDLDVSYFVRRPDLDISEILGFSSPVADLDTAQRFYRRLGLQQVYGYELESSSFEHLIGAGQRVRLRGRNYGTEQRDPMIGLVHYGLPPQSFVSLGQRARLPNLGLAAVCLEVTDATSLEATCRKADCEILHPASDAQLHPYGAVRSLLIAGPHGVLHHALETATQTGADDG